MVLHLDIPTPAELAALAEQRSDIAVSIYLPTTPVSTETTAERIQLKNLASDAESALRSAGADKRRVAALMEEIEDLHDDSQFWRHQANGLAILATPDEMRTYRVATGLEPSVDVSDRFHLKPLMRTMNYFDACYVLALSEGAARLIEVPADLPPMTVDVPGLPEDAAASGRGRALVDGTGGDPSTGGETARVRLRHYCRQIDGAIRGLLAGGSVPLVLASDRRIAEIYRSVSSYPHLATQRIDGNPERLSEAELASRARPILDELHDQRIEDWHRRFDDRNGADRASTDLGRVARAATYGAVESLLIDMDAVVPGSVDDEGRIRVEDSGDVSNYGVTDEIARRVILTGGEVLVVRADELRDGSSPVAATLRYAI
jgi:hypothetical protein